MISDHAMEPHAYITMTMTVTVGISELHFTSMHGSLTQSARANGNVRGGRRAMRSDCVYAVVCMASVAGGRYVAVHA